MHESAPRDPMHPVPPAARQIQVGSSFQVQSLLPNERFVNNIWPALRSDQSCMTFENIPLKVEVAYDGAANHNVTPREYFRCGGRNALTGFRTGCCYSAGVPNDALRCPCPEPAKFCGSGIRRDQTSVRRFL
jgi:hypothetical protein